jgi:hypothetical protein
VIISPLRRPSARSYVQIGVLRHEHALCDGAQENLGAAMGATFVEGAAQVIPDSFLADVEVVSSRSPSMVRFTDGAR